MGDLIECDLQSSERASRLPAVSAMDTVDDGGASEEGGRLQDGRSDKRTEQGVLEGRGSVQP